MSSRQIIGVVLVALGVLGALVGRFGYTTEEHNAEFGPVGIEVEERERIPIPLWLSIGLIATGGLIFVAARRK